MCARAAAGLGHGDRGHDSRVLPGKACALGQTHQGIDAQASTWHGTRRERAVGELALGFLGSIDHLLGQLVARVLQDRANRPGVGLLDLTNALGDADLELLQLTLQGHLAILGSLPGLDHLIFELPEQFVHGLGFFDAADAQALSPAVLQLALQANVLTGPGCGPLVGLDLAFNLQPLVAQLTLQLLGLFDGFQAEVSQLLLALPGRVAELFLSLLADLDFILTGCC